MVIIATMIPNAGKDQSILEPVDWKRDHVGWMQELHATIRSSKIIMLETGMRY